MPLSCSAKIEKGGAVAGSAFYSAEKDYGRGTEAPVPAEYGVTAVFVHAKASHAINE